MNLLDPGWEMRRLRGFCHKQNAKHAYASLRPQAECLHPTSSNHLQVNPYINLYIYLKNKKICSVDDSSVKPPGLLVSMHVGSPLLIS